MPMSPEPCEGRTPSLLAAVPVSDQVVPLLFDLVADPDRLAQLHELLGPFCHDFRNRLNSIHLTLYLADPQSLPPAQRETLEAHYRDAQALIELVHGLVRPCRLSPIHVGLELLVHERANAWEPALRQRGIDLELHAPAERAMGLFDPLRLSQALETFYRWRLSVLVPGQTLRLAWRHEAGLLRLDWEELPSPTATGTEPAPGAGLFTLANLARVVAGQGGRLGFSERPRFQVALSWPAEGPQPVGSRSPGPGLDRHAGRPLG